MTFCNDKIEPRLRLLNSNLGDSHAHDPYPIRHAATERVAKAEIVTTISKLSQDILRNDPNVTAILVEEAAPTDWFIAGRSLTKSAKRRSG
jgi:phenylpyruvate tautomerase PptA (4-oxalocrotonate tautomerase family)